MDKYFKYFWLWMFSLHELLKKKFFIEHNGAVSDSNPIMTDEQTSKSSSGSTRLFLNLPLKTKKSGKKLFSKSNSGKTD